MVSAENDKNVVYKPTKESIAFAKHFSPVQKKKKRGRPRKSKRGRPRQDKTVDSQQSNLSAKFLSAKEQANLSAKFDQCGHKPKGKR